MKRSLLEIIGFASIVLLFFWATQRAFLGSGGKKSWLNGQSGPAQVSLVDHEAKVATGLDFPLRSSFGGQGPAPSQDSLGVAGSGLGELRLETSSPSVSAEVAGLATPDPAAQPRADSPSLPGAPQKLSDLWFLPNTTLQSLSKRNFAVVRRGECSESLKVSKDFLSFVSGVFPDLSSTAQSSNRISERGPLPLVSSSYHVLAATLFLRLENEYLQIQATWNQNLPSSYSIRALAFASPTLQGIPRPRQFDVLDPSKRYDIAGMRDVFRQIAALAPEGAVLAQQIADFDGKTQRVVRYFGPIPVSYDGPNEFCSLDLAANKATCDCSLR